MEKVIKFLVDDQAAAKLVIEKLNYLDKKGDISLAESYVLDKDNHGNVQLNDERGKKYEYTTAGVVSGSLIGLLGGAAGFALGTAFGGLIGAMEDISTYSSQQAVVDSFGKQMPDGKSMVISHVYEDWVSPIDAEIGNFAEIDRINVTQEYDDEIQAEIDKMSADIDANRQKIKNSVGQDKEDLEKKIDELEARRKAKKEEYHANILTRKKAYKKWFEGIKN